MVDIVMVVSAAVNYFIARDVGKRAEEGRRLTTLSVIAVVFNIGLLAVFKYSAFAVSSINSAFGAKLPVPQFASPLGISFFTFQALSYVLDVKAGRVRAERSFPAVLLYISFFAQLLQGPIIRYGEIKD